MRGLDLFLQIVGPKIIRIVSVPFLTFFPMPLSFTLRVTAGHLTIFKFWIGHKPPSTNPAWTFFTVWGLQHRFLSFRKS